MIEAHEDMQKASPAYSSVSEIHNALMRNAYTPRELFDYIKENYEKWSEPKSGQMVDLIRGSEGDYHNLSVEFSRKDCEPFAAGVAMIGVSIYPMSTDLLADLIKYSQEIGETAMCKYGVDKLKDIDRQYWTWRTFVFVIDYLKDSMGTMKSIDEFKGNLEEAKNLIEDFKKYIPHEERAYVAEAELNQNQNNYQAALAALLDGVKNVPVAPQCCMKLADYYLELGQYAKAEEYAKKGILMSIQDQPTISVGYLYYILALSQDAKRIIARQEGKSMDSSEIIAIMTAYETADRLFVNEGRVNVSYRKTIDARKIMLEMEEGVSETEMPGQNSEAKIEKLSQLVDFLRNSDAQDD